MRKNLVEFLFGSDAALKDENLGEQIIRLFEEADAMETEQLAVHRQPLAAALKALGVEAEPVCQKGWCEIHCQDEAEYRKLLSQLQTPDAMTELAERGWVLAQCGDQAMSNEPPDFKLGFIEIATAEAGAADQPDETIRELVQKSRKEAAAKPEAGAQTNPVNRSGQAEESRTDKSFNTAAELVNQVLETTTACSIPPVEAPLGQQRVLAPKRRLRRFLKKPARPA